jgi:hypothetical protein
MRGPGLESGSRCDVHDTTAATLHHGRQEKVRQCGECGDVEVDLAADFLLRHLREFAEGSEAGVVDEDVDGDAFALELVEEELGCGSLGEIEGDGLHCDALRLQFFGHLREVVGAAGYEHQVVVVTGEELGEFVSDAAGGAGDEGGSCRHGGFSRSRFNSCR